MFENNDKVEFWCKTLGRRIQGILIKHWVSNRYKIMISEKNQPKYVYISKENLTKVSKND